MKVLVCEGEDDLKNEDDPKDEDDHKIKTTLNKLGLSWAKLSSSWD